MTDTTPTPQPLDADMLARVRNRLAYAKRRGHTAMALRTEDASTLLDEVEALRTERDRLAAAAQAAHKACPTCEGKGFYDEMTPNGPTQHACYNSMHDVLAAPSDALAEVKAAAVLDFARGYESGPNVANLVMGQAQVFAAAIREGRS